MRAIEPCQAEFVLNKEVAFIKVITSNGEMANGGEMTSALHFKMRENLASVAFRACPAKRHFKISGVDGGEHQTESPAEVR